MSLANAHGALVTILLNDASLLAWAQTYFNKARFTQLDVQQPVDQLSPGLFPLIMIEMADAVYDPPLLGGQQQQLERTLDVSFGFLESDYKTSFAPRRALIDLMPRVLMANRRLTVNGVDNADSAWVSGEQNDQNIYHPKHFVNFSIRVAYTVNA